MGFCEHGKHAFRLLQRTNASPKRRQDLGVRCSYPGCDRLFKVKNGKICGSGRCFQGDALLQAEEVLNSTRSLDEEN